MRMLPELAGFRAWPRASGTRPRSLPRTLLPMRRPQFRPATSVVEVVVVMVPLEPARLVFVAARVIVPDYDVVMVAVTVDLDMIVRPPFAIAALVILGRGRGRRDDDGRGHQACKVSPHRCILRGFV